VVYDDTGQPERGGHVLSADNAVVRMVSELKRQSQPIRANL